MPILSQSHLSQSPIPQFQLYSSITIHSHNLLQSNCMVLLAATVLLELPLLSSIIIRDHCFQTLPQFILYDLPSLYSVSISSNSFSVCSFTVMNNSLLHLIEIGQNSFMKGSLKLSQCSYVTVVLGSACLNER